MPDLDPSREDLVAALLIRSPFTGDQIGALINFVWAHPRAQVMSTRERAAIVHRSATAGHPDPFAWARILLD